ncbi:MAG: hypothetical protein ACRD5L_06740, partial [Bryobacteraceae bacterium]
MWGKKIFAVSAVILFGAAIARGQAPPAKQEPMPGMEMPGAQKPGMNGAGMFLMERTSGTGANPESARMKMISKSVGGWNLMIHGQGFISDAQQTGPRGGDKFFSTNWFMGMAEH